MFEYKQITTYPTKAIKELNELGKQEWELVAVIQDLVNKNSDISDICTYILKRQIPQLTIIKKQL